MLIAIMANFAIGVFRNKRFVRVIKLRNNAHGAILVEVAMGLIYQLIQAEKKRNEQTKKENRSDDFNLSKFEINRRLYVFILQYNCQKHG